jgi:very-short-patch-repair endonuclease
MRDGFEPGDFGNKRRSGYRTDIERLTEAVLLELNIIYLFEHKVSRYSVDFALPLHGIALECDGWQHLTLEGREHDKTRDAFLESQGWRVVHVLDREIRTDAGTAIRRALGIKK